MNSSSSTVSHTSIEKITKACGIGKGTFYHYFPSKEWLILALMEKQAADSLRHFQSHHNGREKMTAAEGREYIKFVINRTDTVYRYMTKAYLQKLVETFPEKEDDLLPDRNINVITMLLSHIEGVRADVDPIGCREAVLRVGMTRRYPTVQIIDSSYYGVYTFTLCEMNPYVLITQQIYTDIHSNLISIPLETDYTLPYGLIYALEPSPAVRKFIRAAERLL